MSRPLKIDPTRTTTLRRQYQQEVNRRFNRFKKLLFDLLIKEDAFGLKRDYEKRTVPISSPEDVIGNKRWRFHTDSRKIEEFQKWIKEQLGETLSVIPGESATATENKWWTVYSEKAYEKGAGRAFDQVKGTKLGKEENIRAYFAGSKDEFLRQSFANPVQVERLKILASRVYTDLRGVTETMSTQLSRELVEGLARGDNPSITAKRMAEKIDISRRRSLTIARTETIRTHAEAQLDTFESLGMTQIKVMSEWITAGDSNVCPLCVPLEGTTYKTSEARGLIPRHPNAVFEDSTFASYGNLQEFIRCWYDGPSIVFTTLQGRFTIGPNHPMLTQRGFIKASELTIGDQVLYDNRVYNSHISSEVFKVDSEKIPMIQDVFLSCSSVGVNSFISPTSEDFHSDGKFCKGKIQVVHTTGSLLRVFDSLGVEHLREGNFVLADSYTVSESGNGSLLFSLDGVSHSSPCSMSGTDSRIFTNGTFSWFDILHVENSSFKGWAYDASTDSSLYCNNGFVVSNCRCMFMPANVGEDPTEQKRDKAEIDKAIDESVKAETGKKRKDKARDESKWIGADKKITKEREREFSVNSNERLL